VLVGVLLWTVGSARPQGRNGSITGTVLDRSLDKLGRGDQEIPNARITVSDTKTKQAFIATTNARGVYTVSQVPLSGTYKVSAEVPGFSPVVYRDVQLSPSGNVRLDFKLSFRSVSPPEEIVVGFIGGVIRDEAGLALPGTRITVLDERSTVQESWTNGFGEYNIHSLRSGTFRVRAERRGFITSVSNDVTLGSPGRLLRDFRLVLDTKSQPAEALAVTFAKRLAETRDFAALIPELFAAGFDDYLTEQLKSPDGILLLTGKPDDIRVGPSLYGLGHTRMDPNVVSALERGEIRRFFAQSANFSYFTILRTLTSVPAAFFSEEPPTQEPAIPTFNGMFPEVVPLFRDDPVLSLWTKPAGDRDVRISTAAQFRQTLSTLERAVPLMRAKVSNPPAERSEQYGSLINGLEQHAYNEGVRTQETVCSSCVPAGTRFIRVWNGLFDLVLVDEKGQLRIAAFDMGGLGGDILETIQPK
jgi:hypothetical protein